MMHPTTDIKNHAETLAETLDLTEKQIEAYLHWYITGDDTTHADIANWMGISPSMATRHLTTAQSHIDAADNTAKAQALKQFLIKSKLGDTTGKTHTIIEAEFNTHAFTVITRESIKHTDRENEQCEIHIGRNDSDWDDSFINGMPDSMTLPTTWRVTSLTANTLTNLVDHTKYYITNTDVHDDVYVTLFHTIKDHPIEAEWLAEKVIAKLENDLTPA